MTKDFKSIDAPDASGASAHDGPDGGRGHPRPAPPGAPVPLKDYLLAAIATEALALGRLPAAFDLGEFGREVERLLLYSLTDEALAEYNSAAYLDARRRVLLPRVPHRVMPGDVAPPGATGLRSLLDLAATGDVDAPLTPMALEPLFLAPRRRDAAPALLLATPSAKLLALRTRTTHTMEPPYLLFELVRYAIDYLGEEDALFAPIFEREGGDEPPLPPETRRALTALSPTRMFALTRAARDYDIALYACALREHVVRRID